MYCVPSICDAVTKNLGVMIVLLQLLSVMKDQVTFLAYLEGYVGVFPAIFIESSQCTNLFPQVTASRTTRFTVNNASKAPSTRIRIILNPQVFLSGFKSLSVHMQRIQIKFARPHAASSRGFSIFFFLTQIAIGSLGVSKRGASTTLRANGSSGDWRLGRSTQASDGIRR